MRKILCQRCGKYFDDHSLFFAEKICTLCKSILREKEEDREREEKKHEEEKLDRLLSKLKKQEEQEEKEKRDDENFDWCLKKVEEELAKEKGNQNQNVINYYLKKAKKLKGWE